ncbi:hypothetical protein N7532_003461 [Penicillium argentinense]|uniref:Uncharacterized protein n=1 Tax=Penicillium argentinense TaxID=1131581 RepID=A0A9W9KF81_9EURO|nr:uncharacterized protein N7532_003461 [Penicillium argentinense]KAJ5102932.1 hypothetical protein N7532_003461 [Penicillium argentinense]
MSAMGRRPYNGQLLDTRRLARDSTRLEPELMYDILPCPPNAQAPGRAEGPVNAQGAAVQCAVPQPILSLVRASQPPPDSGDSSVLWGLV